MADTVLPADSVECLPLNDASCVGVCGCYRLDAASGVREGRVWVASVRWRGGANERASGFGDRRRARLRRVTGRRRYRWFRAWTVLECST